jgi:hypothetical protein
MRFTLPAPYALVTSTVNRFTTDDNLGTITKMNNVNKLFVSFDAIDINNLCIDPNKYICKGLQIMGRRGVGIQNIASNRLIAPCNV